MGRWWELLAEYDSETTAYTEAAGVAVSPFSPKTNAQLIALRVEIGRDAATSLINSIQFRLTSATFNPLNAIEAGGVGSGLSTAPAFQPNPTDWPVDQPVQAGVPIKIEGRNTTADTPVTVSAFLWGLFEA